MRQEPQMKTFIKYSNNRGDPGQNPPKKNNEKRKLSKVKSSAKKEFLEWI